MWVRKTSDWFTEYYNAKEDKKRLRLAFLDILDNTTASLWERAGMWARWDTIINEYDNIEQAKKELKRVLDQKK